MVRLFTNFLSYLNDSAPVQSEEAQHILQDKEQKEILLDAVRKICSTNEDVIEENGLRVVRVGRENTGR